MIAIVDTGGANLTSLENAFDRIGVECKISVDRHVLDQASHLILPGVGHAKVAENRLKETELNEYLKHDKRPILGICLGFQILYSTLEEGTHLEVSTQGLSILEGEVVKLKPSEGFNVPHMGWSQLVILNHKSKLLKDILPEDYFYFVHSYVTPMNKYVTALAKQNDRSKTLIPATLEYKNFYATQFHPEKSGLVGEKLLKNFLDINT